MQDIIHALLYRQKPAAPRRVGFTPNRFRAFTLIEILFVISIIAVLAAMLFPVFTSVRAKSRQTVCASNLRQVGVAISLYAQDFDERYPYAVDPTDKFGNIWEGDAPFLALLQKMPLLPDALFPYTKSRALWQCPADTGFEKTDTQVDRTGAYLHLPASPTCFEKYGTSYFYRTRLAFSDQHYNNLAAYEIIPQPNGDPNVRKEYGTAEIIISGDIGGFWHGFTAEGGVVNALMGDGHITRQTSPQVRGNASLKWATGN